MSTSKNPIGPRYGVYIAGPSPQSVNAVRAGVTAILSAPHADEKTKRAALEAFTRALNTGGNTISNLSISNL